MLATLSVCKCPKYQCFLFSIHGKLFTDLGVIHAKTIFNYAAAAARHEQ